MSDDKEMEDKRKRHAEHQRMYVERNKSRVKEIEKRHREKVKASSPVLVRIRKRIHRRRERRSSAGIERKRKENLARSRKTAFAENHGSRWSRHEIEIIFDATKTDAEISKQLGRSMAAIIKSRIRYKDLAPLGWISKGNKARGCIT